jgi:hypothetical protein
VENDETPGAVTYGSAIPMILLVLKLTLDRTLEIVLFSNVSEDNLGLAINSVIIVDKLLIIIGLVVDIYSYPLRFVDTDRGSKTGLRIVENLKFIEENPGI